MAAGVSVSVMDPVVDFTIPSTEVVKLSKACSTVCCFSLLCALVPNTLELAKTGHQQSHRPSFLHDPSGHGNGLARG